MMGGQQAPTEPRRVNSEVSRWGQASSNKYQTVCGCKDTMKSFFNGRAWNYLELLKIESGVLLRLEKETKDARGRVHGQRKELHSVL